MVEPDNNTIETPTVRELGGILDLTASFPEVVKVNPGVAKLAENAIESTKGTPKKTTETPPVVKADADEPETDIVEPDVEPEEEPKTTLFSNKKGTTFKTQDEVNKYLEKTFSVKTPDDYGKFIKNVNTWRNDSQKFAEVNEQFDALKETLQNLPPEIANPMRAWANGEDYRSHMRNLATTPDFTKPAERQDKELIVNYFYPNKFTKEDFDDFEDNVALKGAYDFAVSTLFPQAKAKQEEQYADLQRKADAKIATIKDSANGSIDNLKKTFPDAVPQRIRKIEQAMLSGDDSKILSLFKNSDGTYKKDAAIKLTLAEYGLADIQELRTLVDEMNEGKFRAVRGAPKTPETPTDVRPVDNRAKSFIETFTGGVDPYANRPKP